MDVIFDGVAILYIWYQASERNTLIAAQQQGLPPLHRQDRPMAPGNNGHLYDSHYT
jgi:hypothetical protein